MYVSLKVLQQNTKFLCIYLIPQKHIQPQCSGWKKGGLIKAGPHATYLLFPTQTANKG